jgi:chromosome segregation ATPase
MRCIELSDHEDGDAEESEASKIEKETRRLMEEALSDEFTGDIGIDEPTEVSDSEQLSPTASSIEETFQRIQSRMEDLLLSIEDSLRNVEPVIDEQVDSAMKKINKRLQTAGLGVFANRAVKIVDNELRKELAAESLISNIYESIVQVRDEISDIVEKASRGAVRNVNRSTSKLQSRIVKMYASIGELEKMLETQRAETKKWRGQTTKLEELIKMRDDSLSRSESDVLRLQESIEEFQRKLNSRGEELSSLKGELKQAESQIEQQREFIDKLDKAEELVTDYEQKVLELSELTGELAEIKEALTQRDLTIKGLKEELALLKEENRELESRYTAISEELSTKKAAEESLASEIGSLKKQMTELKARWETLYNVAEDEPAFKAYFLIADKEHTWLPLSHLSKALGIPTALLKRNLQKFLDVGLIEMESDKIRARKLSEVAVFEVQEDVVLPKAKDTDNDSKESTDIDTI